MRKRNVMAAFAAALILSASPTAFVSAQSNGEQDQDSQQQRKQQKQQERQQEKQQKQQERQNNRQQEQQERQNNRQQQKQQQQQERQQQKQQRQNSDDDQNTRQNQNQKQRQQQERQNNRQQEQREQRQKEQQEQRQQRQKEQQEQRQQRQKQQGDEQNTRQKQRQQEQQNNRQQEQREQRQKEQQEQRQQRQKEQQERQNNRQQERQENNQTPSRDQQQNNRSNDNRQQNGGRDQTRGGQGGSSASDQDLNDRVRRNRDAVNDSKLDKKARDAAREQLQKDRQELMQRRIGGGGGNPNGTEEVRGRQRDNDPDVRKRREERARDVLRDDRKADQLDEKALRRRLDENRDALQRRDLSDRERDQLLERLDRDRQTLRGRVTRDGNNREPGWNRYDEWQGERDFSNVNRRYVDDRRNPKDLNERDLRRRANDIEWLIANGKLSRDEERRYRRILDDDRDYLRRRLRDDRDDRWRRRDEWRYRDRETVIYIEPGVVFVPQPYISIAEYPEDVVYGQLSAPPLQPLPPQQTYTPQQVMEQPEIRELMPAIDLDIINFGFNEAFVRPEEIEKLDTLGQSIEEMLAKNPQETFLIEGHTDAVGSDAANLELSRKRAEAVKQALVEYYVIEPDSLQTVGYGKRYLKIPTPEPEQENRRVSVRRITPLIAGN
ncbi:outer membrane protein OmpA-like peptidoglycan-associated protein [Rhodoligotrophos appendicifer]|uniref:OmpA family protein n=1 Tax=Rhodoligotrophos appendicifer TaxID=987056 RepID=UPI0014790FB8|nr:OmpA family protein [Rhodoligotrophos appendicifer]